MIAVNYIDDAEVVQLGREIRFHEEFSPAGTNIIFVRLKKTVVRNPACPSGLC
jgi:diaminopimelate epimerase